MKLAFFDAKRRINPKSDTFSARTRMYFEVVIELEPFKWTSWRILENDELTCLISSQNERCVPRQSIPLQYNQVTDVTRTS